MSSLVSIRRPIVFVPFPLRSAGVITLGFALVCVLSLASFQRARLFTSEESLLQDAIARNPTAWAAHNDLGCLYAQQNRYSEAMDLFQASLRHNPEHADAHVNLGQTFLCLQRPADAEPHFAAVLRRNPAHADAHRGIAKILAMRKREHEAVLHLRAALRAKPDAQTHTELAALLYQNGDHAGAVTELRQALSLNATNIEALNNLAWLLATAPQPELRNAAEALACARRACTLTGFTQTRSLGILAAAHAEAGHFKQAIHLGEKSLRLAEQSGDPRSAAISRQLLQLYCQGQPYHEVSHPKPAGLPQREVGSE